MIKRPKIYYPKSKIITNLYTSGKEWMLADTFEEYKGFYHKYLDGIVLSEAIYGPKSKKLIPYIDPVLQPNTALYDSLKEITSKQVTTPFNVFNRPTLKDYGKGSFTRYFIYRRNFSDIFNDFFEVNETQYKSWKKPKFGIDEKLYNAFTIQWRLTGPYHDNVIDGHTKEFGVYDTNRRLAFLNDKVFPGTSKVLTDYIEHSVYSNLTPENIRKQFGN